MSDRKSSKVVMVDFKTKKTVVNIESDQPPIIKAKSVKKVAPAEEGSIGSGQWAEMKDLVELWVTTSKKTGKPVSWGSAYKQVYRQATSRGKKGVTRWNDYPVCDYIKGMKFIQQKITILKNEKSYRDNDPETWVKDRKIAIKSRLRQLKISSDTEHEYLLAVYGYNSISKLSPSALDKFYRYVFGSKPLFLIPKPKEKSTQQLREIELDRVIKLMSLDGYEALPMGKNDVWQLLKANSPTLFGDLGSDSFNKFWTKQKLYSCRRGKPSRAKEHPKT